MRIFLARAAAMMAAALAVVSPMTIPAAHATGSGLSGINHIVVIYEENHSFDNLWGLWPGVDGLNDPGVATHKTQVDQTGAPLSCLKQVDVNLTSPPLSTVCSSTAPNASPAAFNSHFTNDPFKIDDYIPSTATTCYSPTQAAPFAPTNGVLNGSGTAGGCTRDIVHRFYQEQYQIHGGLQDRYSTGSDAAGLTQGYYDTTQLPLYQYLTTDPSAPNYVVLDHFFQGGYGGSFLNHQMLVAAQPPVFTGANTSGVQTGCNTGTVNCDLHSVVDTNGFPNNSYPLYASPQASQVKDNQLTEAANGSGNCAPSYPGPAAPAGTKCGDYAVNTIQPFNQPYSPGTAVGKRLPPLTSPNIGDELTAAGKSWKWYSGGWDNAAGVTSGPGWTMGAGPSCPSTALSGSPYPNCPDLLFQFHHQAFNYFANYGTDTPAHLANRAAHLQDEKDFLNDAAGTLPVVSFVKPLGNDNEHPGYASTAAGDQHLVNLIKAVENGPNASDTAIVITYDEFGGQWDHVSPPASVDGFGPGTRVPAMIIAPTLAKHAAVDHTVYDTTSIVKTFEANYGLPAMSTHDAAVTDLSPSFGGDTADLPESPVVWALPLGAVALALVATRLSRRRRPALH